MCEIILENGNKITIISPDGNNVRGHRANINHCLFEFECADQNEIDEVLKQFVNENIDAEGEGIIYVSSNSVRNQKCDEGEKSEQEGCFTPGDGKSSDDSKGNEIYDHE